MTVSFYTAGKIWHAPKFQELRDSLGFNVRARWIDLDNESHFVQKRKDLLWNLCFEDVRDSDFLLLYSEDQNEEQRGALVEVGMAFGLNKPVYAINRCKSLTANGISDVAFTHFKNWTWLDTSDLVLGAYKALHLYHQQHGKNMAFAA